VILVAYDAVHMGQEQVTSERQQYGEEFHHHSRADKNRWREELEQRFPGAIAGVLSCYDRVILQGTLPGICFAGGMEKFLRTQGILLKDYTQWALPLAEQLKARAASLAAEAGISIEFLRKKVRKETGPGRSGPTRQPPGAGLCVFGPGTLRHLPVAQEPGWTVGLAARFG